MQSFLSEVTKDSISKHEDLSHVTFILPSKRAGLFLKSEIKEQVNHSAFFPRIVSIEDFIIEISNLENVDNVTLLFEFYKVYLANCSHESADSFDVFSKWAHILLQDFNEIDSNLIDAENILSYVSDSKRIESWNLKNDEQTTLATNYLNFFKKIEIYYKQLYAYLLGKQIGYQGMLYREANNKTASFVASNKETKFIFAGFNALTKAEEKIIHSFLLQGIAEIYWDTDSFYLENNLEAGKYFKEYQKNWAFYNTHSFNWIRTNFNTEKNIQIYGVPKNITQIKKVASILKEIYKTQGNLQNTAVVLSNEKLLPVLLNSLPNEVKNANITMGYSLQNIPAATLFELIFKLHLNRIKFNRENAFYYKDVLNVLKHPTIFTLWNTNENLQNNLNKLIFKNKTLFISASEIEKLCNDEPNLKVVFSYIFDNTDTNTEKTLKNFIEIIAYLKNQESLNYLEKEYLFHFHTVFQQLTHLNKEFNYIHNLKTLYHFYKQILKTENLSFQGEPLKGLQIMGMLESRVLDFENVILTSVNEGFIPSGNTQNSFIPFDIKNEKGMPTYQEKDAIFAYHFYKLIQRAKNIFLLYNSETDDFGSGEQSRFITQLEIAKENGLLDQVSIQKNIVIPQLHIENIDLKEVPKTEEVVQRLNEIASKGFSPSSLASYIRNPIDFYKKKILKLKEVEDVEETIASNTFGTIIHETLRELYTPFINSFISKEIIKGMKTNLKPLVLEQFKNYYSLNSIGNGKNLLTFEIAIQFLRNFLNYEISELEKGKKIKIIDIEKEISIQHNIKEIDAPIRLNGHIDRIDEVDGVLRIVDYKTGKVEVRNLNFNDWDLLSTEEQYSKSFQVLMYAYLHLNAAQIDCERIPIESGIISFKNLKSGFMKVNKGAIDKETMEQFELQLNKLILEIYNLDIPFTEKELN
jgi:hypothetical protein